MNRPSKLQVVVSYLILTLFSIAALYPVMWVVKMALSPSQSFSLSASPLPTEVSLDNFADLVTARDMDGNHLFLHQLTNSVIVSLATTLVGVILAATAAFAFSLYRFPGKKGGMELLLTTQMFPGVVMTIPLYIILEKLNLLDSMAGLVLVYSATAVPFCVWMLKGFFDTIPRDLYEAALMDGMGPWRIFFKIYVPLARPGLVVTALFSFMTAWNEFILAATFLSEPTSYHPAGDAPAVRGGLLHRVGALRGRGHPGLAPRDGGLLRPPAAPGRRADGRRRERLAGAEKALERRKRRCHSIAPFPWRWPFSRR